MAWDFETEPELAEQLDWMRELVREEIQPLEVLDLEWEQLSRAMEPLQERVKERGLWAAHLDPELRPDEVHRESVARQILRGYQPARDGLPTEHIPTRREAARERFSWLVEAVTSND